MRLVRTTSSTMSNSRCTERNFKPRQVENHRTLHNWTDTLPEYWYTAFLILRRVAAVLDERN